VRLTRVHSAGAGAEGAEIALSETAATHVARVLRLRAGDPLIVFDGHGSDFRAEIAAIAGGAVRARLIERLPAHPESPLSVTLVQAVSRGDRMDWTLQKATELGVRTIVPVFAGRSVVRLDTARAETRLRHWQAVVVSACEQSGRSFVPEVRRPEPLRAYLAATPSPALRVLLDPEAETELADLAPAGDDVHLLIGPEGGLDEAERAATREAGFGAVRLGPRVLRTETAGVVALSVLQSRWGDLAGTAPHSPLADGTFARIG